MLIVFIFCALVMAEEFQSLSYTMESNYYQVKAKQSVGLKAARYPAWADLVRRRRSPILVANYTTLRFILQSHPYTEEYEDLVWCTGDELVKFDHIACKLIRDVLLNAATRQVPEVMYNNLTIVDIYIMILLEQRVNI